MCLLSEDRYQEFYKALMETANTSELVLPNNPTIKETLEFLWLLEASRHRFF